MQKPQQMQRPAQRPVPQRPVPSQQRIAPRADFVPDSPGKVAVGNRIEHERFGMGTVISLEGDVTNRKAVVDFEVHGRKTLLLKFAKVRVIS
jgi:DNA helicase-2/ATP-dependent DNA helicase PcrA